MKELDLSMEWAVFPMVASQINAWADTEIDAADPTMVCLNGLVWYADKTPVAAALVESHDGTLSVWFLAVNPRWRGKGVASQVIRMIEGHARSEGYGGVELQDIVDERFANHFIKNGYATTGGGERGGGHYTLEKCFGNR